MKERPVVIGEEPALVGVLTEPSSPGADRPACILINAGLVHRVGPNRLYVQLARRLAAGGYPVLRFDLSGRGDSEVRRDGRSFLESSILEVREAMAFVRKATGAEHFVLAGICSGAINSVQTAAADPQVVGAVAIDAPAYPTFQYYLRYYARRLRQREAWSNIVQRVVHFARTTASVGPADDEEGEYAYLYGDATAAPQREVAQVLQGIVDRGTNLMFIFSGSWSMYNYRRQFRDAFPSVAKTGRVRVEYFPDADHTFTRLHHQQLLIATIADWMSANWPASSAATEPVPSQRPHGLRPADASR